MSRMTEAPHTEELTYEEMRRLLPTEEVGRLAVVVGHHPQVFPVNYRMDADIVVFRTRDGTKLRAAHHSNVSFEVDHIDPVSRSGWSIVIEGVAEDTTDLRPGPSVEHSRRVDVDPWAGGDESRLVRILPTRMTGRRIRPAVTG